MKKYIWNYQRVAASAMALLFSVATGCQSVNQQNEANLARMERMMEQQERMLTLIEINRRLDNEASTHTPAPAPVQSPAIKKVPAKKESPVTGRISSIGSDTMDNLMDYWQASFRETHPNVAFYHQGKGSSTAIPALAEGKATLGPMSRKLKESEIQYFQKKFNYAPTQVRVALDCVAVYVHPDNPLAKQGLTLKQLDQIFSKTLLRGGKEALTWGDLGLTGDWSKAPIHVYGRNQASGTHSFFKKSVLTKAGAYTDRCKALSGSEELVQTIAKDPYGIGYSGIGYKNDTVAALPVSADNPSNAFPPELYHAYSGEYPLTRFLYIAVKKDPSSTLDPLTRKFIEHVYSSEGQDIVAKDGFYSLSSKVILKEKAKLGLY